MFASDIDGTTAIAVTAITFSLSYLLNLLLVSYFMPRFTLCVSVGQLTDRATLNESLAEYRLKKLMERSKKETRRKDKSDGILKRGVRFLDKHIRRTSSESNSESQARGEPTKVVVNDVSDPQLDHLSPNTAQHVDFLSNQFATDPANPIRISIDTSQNAR